MSLSQKDVELFHAGTHTSVYEVMGGRLCDNGATFAVWAPNAKSVSVLGDFNKWQRASHPMKRGETGIWTCEISGLSAGTKYQFAIEAEDGEFVEKADPFGLSAEFRPGKSSILTDDHFDWTDDEWMQREHKFVDQPLNIYEVHLGSWKLKDGEFYNYREVVHELADYCKEMGYTHIELLPLTEHPLDESWGYQVTGYYSVTSRYGSPADFQYFVNEMHRAGIGVIFDWVPGHFPIDTTGIGKFDGKSLFEHDDPTLGYQPKWDTLVFDYGKPEVRSFLIGSALYWLDKMHLDGLRVDAVCSMVHRNFGREEGEWTPNIHGGVENLEAISFLQQLNLEVHEKFPSALMIAEDTQGYQGLTKKISDGGVGFDMKWNVGWTHHILLFLKNAHEKRVDGHNELIYPFTFIYQDNYILVLSHDDVANGKDSLFGKMPDAEFCNLRLLLGLKMTMPGKKLLFMGGEFGQREKWGCKEEAHFHLLEDPHHAQVHQYTRDLNNLYLNTPALYEIDFSPDGVEWLEKEGLGYISFIRKGRNQRVLCLHNYLEHHIDDVSVFSGKVFTSDAKEYGGCGILGDRVESGKITLPRLSTTIIILDE
jgi:1,4-alpha-glucan branching enzyme